MKSKVEHGHYREWCARTASPMICNSMRRWRARTVLVATPLLAAILAGLNSGCATYGPELSGYTCCNFHYDRDRRSAGSTRRLVDRYWISDANWSSLPMIPAGTPIRTKSYSRYSVKVDVDVAYTQEMVLGLDFGRDQNIAIWVRKMIVPEDPRSRIRSWSEPVRRAVSAGKVAIGMTREQVIVSLGYPPAHETPSLDRDHWKYWYGTFDSFVVVWDEQGRVKDVDAHPPTRSAVLQ